MSSRACASRPSRRATSPACERQGIDGRVGDEEGVEAPCPRRGTRRARPRGAPRARRRARPPCAARPRPTGRRLRRCSPAPRRPRRAGRSRAARRRGSALAACRYACWPPRHASTAVRASSTASPTGPVRTSCRARTCDAMAYLNTDPSRRAAANARRRASVGLVVLVRPAEDADDLDERRRVVVELVDEGAARVQPAYDGERLVGAGVPRRTRASSALHSSARSAAVARRSSAMIDVRATMRLGRPVRRVHRRREVAGLEVGRELACARAHLLEPAEERGRRARACRPRAEGRGPGRAGARGAPGRVGNASTAARRWCAAAGRPAAASARPSSASTCARESAGRWLAQRAVQVVGGRRGRPPRPTPSAPPCGAARRRWDPLPRATAADARWRAPPARRSR